MKSRVPGEVVKEKSRSRFILGMRVDASSYEAATALVMEWAVRGESRYVCEAPINMVMEAYDSPEYRKCINEADLVVCGGMPIVWLMRLLGVRRQPRVYGPEFRRDWRGRFSTASTKTRQLVSATMLPCVARCSLTLRSVQPQPRWPCASLPGSLITSF